MKDYRSTYSFGVASRSAMPEKKQQLAELLERAMELSDEIQVSTCGYDFSLICKNLIAAFQRSGDVPFDAGEMKP